MTKAVTLTLERDALADALAGVARIVERRNTIPILSHLMIAAGAEGVTLTGTDLDITASATLPMAGLGLDAASAICVPAALLNDIVRKLGPGSQISLAWGEDRGAAGGVTLRGGRARFALQSLPASDFPQLPDGDEPIRFSLDAARLATALDVTAFAMSSEETRYYLNGIHWSAIEVEGVPTLRLVATDGHRLALTDLPLPEGAAGMPGIIVPRKFIGEMQRLAGEALRTDEPLAISLSGTRIRVTVGRTTLVSKLIDGTFPDYERVIPRANPHTVRVEAEPFGAAIDRVMALQSERGSGVKLEIKAGGIGLSASNAEAGSAEDEVDATLEGEPATIGFNGRYLAEILVILGGKLKAARPISLLFQDAGGPALLRREGDRTLLIVLMPMRV